MSQRKRIITAIILLCLGYVSHAQTVEESLQKIAGQISQGITKHNKKRVAVTNFLDLQNNVTELGRFLAESFSMELVNSSSTLEVVDRSQISRLLEELKMSEEKLLEPANATKLGNMAGIEVIITGTISALDNSVYVTAKAIDIQRGIIIAARQGTIPRTDAVNALLRSTISGSSTSAKPSAVATLPKAYGDTNIDAVDDVHQVKSTPMKESICRDDKGIYSGYICFESQLPKDLILYKILGKNNVHTLNTLVSSAGKACSPLIRTSPWRATEKGSVEVTFYFKTTDPQPMLGQFIMVAEGCQTKSIVLHPRNIVFTKN